jgi:hypothetical protein
VPSLSGAFVLALDIGVLTSRTILGVSA